MQNFSDKNKEQKDRDLEQILNETNIEIVIKTLTGLIFTKAAHRNKSHLGSKKFWDTQHIHHSENVASFWLQNSNKEQNRNEEEKD